MTHKSERNSFPCKRIVLSLIIISLIAFVIIQKALFLITEDHSERNEAPEIETAITPQAYDISGNQVLRQYFRVPLSDLKKISLRIKIDNPKTAAGSLSLQIFDENGVLVAENEREINTLSKKSKTTYAHYSLPAKLKVNTLYELVISTHDADTNGSIAVYGVPYKGTMYGDLYMNDQLQNDRLITTFTVYHYNLKLFLMLIGMLLITLVWIWIPIEKLQQLLDRHMTKSWNLTKLLSRILFIASPFAAFMIVQCYAGYGFKPFAHLLFSQAGILNLLMYVLFTYLAYMICNRTRYASAATVLIFSLIGLANYFVWSFRNSPIIAADLMSLGTAMDVADHYTYSLNSSSICAIIYTAIFIILVLNQHNYCGLTWKKRVCMFLIFAISSGGFYKFIYKDNYFEKHNITLNVWNPAVDYADNGCLVSFLLSYMYFQMDQPEGYSVSDLQKVVDAYPSDAADSETERIRPNIIAIMNETFSDLSADGDLHISEDCMPFIHSLHENTVRGNLYVSVYGGNTANSEFEFLTGSSMAFMPFRCIPYNQNIKSDMPSLTTVLKDNGYLGNYAIHPGTRTAWSRDVVYPLLGFDEFFTADNFAEPEYLRELITDKCDYEYILSKYNETKSTSQNPFYTFTVTIQDHGGYDDSKGSVDNIIQVTDSEQYSYQLEQYVNLIRISDESFKNLVEYFENIDEPTVIVMFGDHQPNLPEQSMVSLFGKSTSEMTLSDIQKKYTVPYLIWANYDIEEAENVNMSANYLSAYLLNVIDAPMSGYQKFLVDLMQKVPAITANFYFGDDGVLHTPDESSEYSNLLLQYQQLQYNNIFDSNHRFEDFYKLKTEE